MTAKPPASEPFRLGYRPALDGVRAVAILVVLAYHFRASDFAYPTRGGFLGVDIFFVLSGFLITSLLLDEFQRRGRISFSRFYARRALRLFPALFAMVAAYLVYTLTIGPDRLVKAVLLETLAAATYWTNWLHSEGLALAPATGLTHTWSLSIEEQFYLLWPVLLLGALALGRRRAAAYIVVAGIVAAAGSRFLTWNGDGSVDRMSLAFDARADVLLVGCGFALVVATESLRRGATRLALRWALWPSLALIALFVTLVHIREPMLYRGGLTLFALATGVILYNLVVGTIPALSRLLETGPMVYVGRISYGLYIWHWPIYIALRDQFEVNRIAAPLAIPLSFAVAALSYRYVEQPFLRLKKRYQPEAQSSAVRAREVSRPAAETAEPVLPAPRLAAAE